MADDDHAYDEIRRRWAAAEAAGRRQLWIDLLRDGEPRLTDRVTARLRGGGLDVVVYDLRRPAGDPRRGVRLAVISRPQ